MFEQQDELGCTEEVGVVGVKKGFPGSVYPCGLGCGGRGRG